MTDGKRTVYLGMARLFLIVGGVVGLLSLADRALTLDVFRGNPIWTSLFLLGIGGLLHWTATTAERRPEPIEESAREPQDDARRERDGGYGRDER
jgi:hypothetical protein